MLLWLVIPIILYFYKIDLPLLITILTMFDFFRSKNLLRKSVRVRDLVTYYDEDCILRYLPEKKWYLNGFKHILQLHKYSILLDLLSAVYKFFLILCYFNFEFYYFKKEIIGNALLLILMTYVGWILGEIFELRNILKAEKAKMR